MNPIITYLCCFSLLSFEWSYCQRKESDSVFAKIESLSNAENGQITIKNYAINNTKVIYNLEYLFVSIKKDASSNVNSNKQSGFFSLMPNETKLLSQITLNLDKNISMKAYLFVKDEKSKELLSKDSLIIDKNKNNPNRVLEESIEIKGLTIDETKSKMGKDFYDKFYMAYNQLPEKFSFTITINELPSLGRGGQILVNVEDRNIYGFLLKPEEEYLEEHVKTLIAWLTEYNNKRNFSKKEFKY